METPAVLLLAPFSCTPKSLTHSFIGYIFMEGLLDENPVLCMRGGGCGGGWG